MADQDAPPLDPFGNTEKTPDATTLTVATETHPYLSKSLKATDPVFLEEGDIDDELDNSPTSIKEKVITPEFVRKNKKALMSELEKNKP
jgi:hypothetical protein